MFRAEYLPLDLIFSKNECGQACVVIYIYLDLFTPPGAGLGLQWHCF